MASKEVVGDPRRVAGMVMKFNLQSQKEKCKVRTKT
jgi:hypothetical protein